MQFSNVRIVGNLRSIEEISLAAFSGLFIISFLDIYDNKWLPFHGYQYALIIALIFVLMNYIWYGFKHTFIDFNSNSDHIIIRYFVIRPKIFKYQPKMIKVAKKDYVKYEIVSSKYFFGQKKALYLYQKTNKGVVKYPPIYVHSLNDTEMYQLKQALKF